MIEIIQSSCADTPSFDELVIDSQCFVLYDLDKSSTKRVWLAKLLVEEMLSISKTCFFRVDNWSIWESGCYMPLFDFCWTSATKSPGLTRSGHILKFKDINNLDTKSMYNLVVVAFLFAWDIVVYKDSETFFALSHDDELILKGLPNSIINL